VARFAGRDLPESFVSINRAAPPRSRRRRIFFMPIMASNPRFAAAPPRRHRIASINTRGVGFFRTSDFPDAGCADTSLCVLARLGCGKLTRRANQKKLSSLDMENFPLAPSGKSALPARPVLSRQEGRIAIVTKRGRGCGGRGSVGAQFVRRAVFP
jgi:hypothetical protein